MLGRSIHTAALACPGSTPLVRGTPSGVWGGPEGAIISETPSSPAHHVLSAGLCVVNLPLPSQLAFPSVGALRQGKAF